MTAKEIWDKANLRMSYEELIVELMESPGKVRGAEEDLHEAKLEVVRSKDNYEDAKNRILLQVDGDGNPVINGKNAEIREAQLNSYLIIHHSTIRQMEELVMEKEREYNLAINTFRALRSVAVLLSGEGR